jgi:membrane associated rhomboid family serine protease
MGIYDREYYRDGPGFLSSLASQGRVTRWLIGINVVCFLLQILTRYHPPENPFDWVEPFTNALILNVPAVLRGEVWRLLTYAFLHSTGDIFHIVWNMLFLFWFGRQVEDTIGGREYLIVYLVSAVLGGVVYVAATALGLQSNAPALGASGAVMAVLLLAACYNPRLTILLFFIIPVPIWGFVILYVLRDAYAFLSRSPSGVAVSIHLAGAAFGFAYYRLGWSLSSLLPSLPGRGGRRSRPRLKLYREDEEEDDTPSPVPAGRRPERLIDDEQLEAQVDAILAKIQHVGMEGLTEKERQTLLKASEAIKRRRG